MCIYIILYIYISRYVQANIDLRTLVPLMPTVTRLSQRTERVSHQLIQAARTGPVKTLSRLGTSLTHVWMVSRSEDELFSLSCTLESNLQQAVWHLPYSIALLKTASTEWKPLFLPLRAVLHKCTWYARWRPDVGIDNQGAFRETNRHLACHNSLPRHCKSHTDRKIHRRQSQPCGNARAAATFSTIHFKGKSKHVKALHSGNQDKSIQIKAVRAVKAHARFLYLGHILGPKLLEAPSSLPSVQMPCPMMVCSAPGLQQDCHRIVTGHLHQGLGLQKGLQSNTSYFEADRHSITCKMQWTSVNH